MMGRVATGDCMWFTALCLCGPAKLLGQFRYEANVDRSNSCFLMVSILLIEIYFNSKN